MIASKNMIMRRGLKKPIVWDAFYQPSGDPKTVVIFCHGYKGFKDWGCWDLVAEAFSASNMFFIKFNFSHNGGTVDQPIDFPDLEAFAENNYSKELDDLESILNHLFSENFEFKDEINPNQITVIGHSRGGGIAIIKASEDHRITHLITWASVSSFGKRITNNEELRQWKEDGVKYVLNGRTKQLMPHNYQFYEDFKANESRFNIKKASRLLNIPFLIVHADLDPTVSFSEAEDLSAWNNRSEILKIGGSNHVFDASHPWNKKEMPLALQEVVTKSISFIN